MRLLPRGFRERYRTSLCVFSRPAQTRPRRANIIRCLSGELAATYQVINNQGHVIEPPLWRVVPCLSTCWESFGGRPRMASMTPPRFRKHHSLPDSVRAHFFLTTLRKFWSHHRLVYPLRFSVELSHRIPPQKRTPVHASFEGSGSNE